MKLSQGEGLGVRGCRSSWWLKSLQRYCQPWAATTSGDLERFETSTRCVSIGARAGPRQHRGQKPRWGMQGTTQHKRWTHARPQTLSIHACASSSSVITTGFRRCGLQVCFSTTQDGRRTLGFRRFLSRYLSPLIVTREWGETLCWLTWRRRTQSGFL